jgi:hypothetical protein
MKDSSYLLYLEEVVLSLLEERGEKVVSSSFGWGTVDIPAHKECEHPSLKGCTFSPYNINEQIQKKRNERTDTFGDTLSS